MGKGAAVWVEPVESRAGSTDPEHTRPVYMQRIDGVIAEAGWILWVVPVPRDLSAVRLQTIQSATKCANP